MKDKKFEEEEILLTIVGKDDIVEPNIEGKHYFRDGFHYYMYQRRPDESGEKTSGRIKYRDSYLEIVHTGQMRSVMIFEHKKSHKASVQTPYGEIHFDIDTKNLLVTQTSAETRIDIDYIQSLEGEAEQATHLSIQIKKV